MFSRLVRFFVNVSQRYLPDAYLFAIILTFVAFAAALIWTDKTPMQLLQFWGGGLWGLLAFAMQMTLILVTGHALASSPVVKGGLRALAQIPQNNASAVMLVVFVAGLASFLNWGFGLVVAALLAREVAKLGRKVDYPMLVAAGYSGFVIWHGGISGSIPLAVATKGHLVEKLTGIIPVSQTIFSVPNLVITFAVIFTLPILFWLVARSKQESELIIVDPALMEEPVAPAAAAAEKTPATVLENSVIVNALFALAGVVYLVKHFMDKGFDLNLNIVIMLFLVVGVILHKTPINYVRAINEAIKGAGGIALQFPLYGGIQGIMVSSGLAAVIAQGFVSIATAKTFPLMTFLAGGLINMFVPSGGGQWAVQGPINIPAGIELGVDPAKIALAISYGDGWTNMLQPFWALPLLGIAKLQVKDIMGYTMLTLIWAGVIFALGLLIF
ncbi:MAG: short-chain fatty acid transporter [Bacillota bacterium]